MIGIDTNILLRHTPQDDPVQAPAAGRFLLDPARAADPALINPVMLLEFAWTLMRRQKLAEADVLAVLDVLLGSTAIAFTDGAAVTAAIENWRTDGADLPDDLIGHLNRAAGAALTLTFDRNAATDPNFALLQI